MRDSRKCRGCFWGGTALLACLALAAGSCQLTSGRVQLESLACWTLGTDKVVLFGSIVNPSTQPLTGKALDIFSEGPTLLVSAPSGSSGEERIPAQMRIGVTYPAGAVVQFDSEGRPKTAGIPDPIKPGEKKYFHAVVKRGNWSTGASRKVQVTFVKGFSKLEVVAGMRDVRVFDGLAWLRSAKGTNEIVAAELAKQRGSDMESVFRKTECWFHTAATCSDAKNMLAEVNARCPAPKQGLDPERQIRARHILVKPETSGNTSEAKSRAQKILQLLRAGADFAAIARKFSDDPGSRAQGGDLDYFRPGQKVAELETAASALKPGQISDVVQSPYGFHIIQVVDSPKTPAGDSPLTPEEYLTLYSSQSGRPTAVPTAEEVEALEQAGWEVW